MGRIVVETTKGREICYVHYGGAHEYKKFSLQRSKLSSLLVLKFLRRPIQLYSNIKTWNEQVPAYQLH